MVKTKIKIKATEENMLEYSTETKEGLKRAYEDIKKGRVFSTKKLIKRLKIDDKKYP